MNGLLMTVVPLQHGVLQIGAVVGHFVGDTVDDDRVLIRLVHLRAAELDELGTTPSWRRFTSSMNAGGNDHSLPTIRPTFSVMLSLS
jgi:hypothetical protein